MPELSPAANEVAKAALYVSSCDPEDYPFQAQEIAAAALRAAAKCLEELPESSDYSFWVDSHVHGIDRGVEKLLAIATELEAQ
jgi:hypothetical protein